MKPVPLVSVLMPVYNCSPYLDEAISSILKQSFADFEFVIVNDGSTDDSLEIIQRHSARDPRIVVLDRPNGGIVDALNAGLEVCQGEFVARMDGDDISLPERFEKQLVYLDNHPEVSLVGSAVELIDSKGIASETYNLPTSHSGIVNHCIDNGSCAVFHPTWFARRKLFDVSSGYDEEFFGAEDVALLLLFQDQLQYANLADVLVKYRRHDNAVGVRLNVKQVRAGELAVRRSCEKFNNVSKKTLSAHAYRASWVCSDAGLHWLGLKYALRSWANSPISKVGPKTTLRCFWSYAFAFFSK